MLCSKCKHKHYDYTEDCMECDLFEYEFPEEYERKDENGCIFNERTIVSRIKAKEERDLKFLQEVCEDMANDLLGEGDADEGST